MIRHSSIIELENLNIKTTNNKEQTMHFVDVSLFLHSLCNSVKEGKSLISIFFTERHRREGLLSSLKTRNDLLSGMMVEGPQ